MAAFEISLDDQTSGPAGKAAKAVNSLSEEFDRLQNSMGKPLAGGANISGLSADFDKLQKSLPKEQQINKGFVDPVVAQENEDAFKGIAAGADEFSESLVGVKQMLAGVAEAAAIAVVILGAYAAALFSAAKMAIRLTQEKDQLRETFEVLNEGGGGALLDELEDLAAALPFTADKVNAWAKSLLAAGIRGEALRTGIKAIAAATAIMGEAGGAAVEGLLKKLKGLEESGGKVKLDNKFIRQLQEAGITLGDLAKQLGVTPEKLKTMTLTAKQLGDAMQQALITKGEGPLKKLGNTWDVISAKMNEGFEDAFEDLGELVGPFMAELQSLASEFFAGGVASTDWKDAVKAAMSGAFAVAKEFVNFIHRGFLHAQIAVLQFRIAIKPVTSVLGEVGLGSAGVSVALYLLKGTVIVLAVVFGILALAVGLVLLPFALIGVAIYYIVQGISYLAGVISGVIDNFGSLKAAAFEAGTGVITGLGNAIQSGAAWVIAIAAGVATGIIGAITGPLKIKSPSRVMMQIGAYTTEGLAMGIDAGAPDVAAAARGAAGSAVGGAAGGAASTTGGKGGVTINIHEGAIVIHEGGDTRALTLEALASVLEEAALQAGLA